MTEWTFDTPIDRVWEVITDAERYPSWWPGFAKVTTLSGDGAPGTIVEHQVRPGPGLNLRFQITLRQRRDPGLLISDVSGDSRGSTEWHATALDPHRTRVTHVWDVEVVRPALRATARIPLAGRFFEWRHRSTMARGRRNLRKLMAEPDGPGRGS